MKNGSTRAASRARLQVMNANNLDVSEFRRRQSAMVPTAKHTIRDEAPQVRGDDTVAVLRLYDPVDSWGGIWGVSAKEFVAVLDELPDTTTEIRLLINSPGGEVTEGMAIVNALRAHDARVVAVVEGIAASAASFIAAAADELVMMKNSELMIHDSWGLCVGNAADLRSLADLLDHLSNNIASIYADKAGGDIAAWRALMLEETWYTADEAVTAGLADRVDDGKPADDSAKARFDLTIFNFAGRREAPAPTPVVDPVDGPPSNPEGGPAVAFSPEQIQQMRQRLNLAADADEATILAAWEASLDAAADPDDDDDEPTAPVLPDGVVAISEAQLQQLQASAQAGVAARAQQITDERTALVLAAVRDGRIAPAERDGWLAKLGSNDRDGVVGETDAVAVTVLAGLKPGLIPVKALGSNGGEIDIESVLDDEHGTYNQLFGAEVKS